MQISRFSPGRLRFFLRKVRHPIPPDVLVVDIGSGGDPHPRADVTVERYAFTAGQRTTAFRRSGLMVVADVHALPFRDRSFGFSICAHVLEHVADPDRAASELSRISTMGYVETPSELHETLMPIGWHRWFVHRERDTLVFEAKPSPFLDERLGQYFRSRWGADRQFMAFVWSHVDDLFVQHQWNGRLVVHVATPSPSWSLDDDQEEDGDGPRDSDRKRALYEVLCRLRYRRS